MEENRASDGGARGAPSLSFSLSFSLWQAADGTRECHVRWEGCGSGEGSWEPETQVNETAACERFAKENPKVG